jgi:Cdc6-like AAA superfamily ATPase
METIIICQPSEQIINASSDMPNSLPYNQNYFVPHNSTGLFTGRDDVLQKLRDCLFPSRNKSRLEMQKRFVLYGLGGSGKTQICTRFAEIHREMLVARYGQVLL